MRDNSDIIELSRPEPRNHPRMAVRDRAAQFAPFAAMVGHDAAIAEVDRVTEPWHEPSDGELSRLSAALPALSSSPRGQTLTVRFFERDERKDGGKYITLDGRLLDVDPAREVRDVIDCGGQRHGLSFSSILAIDIGGKIPADY